MAKVIGPLLSLDARGTVAKAITYQKNLSGNIVTKIPGHKDHPTVAQENQREKYLQGVGAWNMSTAENKALWVDAAVGRGMTGFNLFMREYLHGRPWILSDSGEEVTIAAHQKPYEGDPNQVYGSFTYATVRGPVGDRGRVVVRVDLTATGRPEGATWVKGILKMFVGQYAGTTGAVMCNQVDQAGWIENQCSWNNYKTGSAWITPGGDYMTGAGHEAESPDPGGQAVYMEWDITDQLAYAEQNQAGQYNGILMLKDESKAGLNYLSYAGNDGPAYGYPKFEWEWRLYPE